MIIEDSNALKSWLTSCLGRNIRCDADPIALAKYILALVKKDKAESELKQFCLDQLEVFFVNPEDTKDFVGLLFETLRTKSYLYTPDSTTNCNEVTSPSNSVTVSTTFVSADSSKLGRADGENEKHNSEILLQSKHSSSSPVKCATGNFVPTIVRQRWDTEDKHEQSHTMPIDEKCDRLFGSSKQIKVRKQDHEQCNYKQTENSVLDKSERKSWKKDERSSNKILSSICKSSSNNHSQSPSSPSSPSSSPSNSRDRLEDPEKCDLWRGKKELPKLSRVEYGDTDYRLKDPGVLNLAYHVNNNISGKDSKRCQDYDEKGYCMRGDLCLFDHGTDPVVVENVSVLNFGLGHALVPDRQDTTKSPLPPPPPTSPPPLPPPPPPLPPLPPTGSYIPEPYNPEAPGMNMRTDPNYLMPSNAGIHIPSLHHSRSQSSGMPNMLLPLTHNTKPPRLRELIGVPTVDVISSTSLSKEDKESLNSDMSKKRKGFDYSRLGPKPKKLMTASANKDTLEVRKVPKHLNSISLLYNHFSKFGTVINIQVGFQNDPEAALIQFQNYSEASAAYKSTDAVLNNRFIKVLWHFKDNKNTFQTEKCDTTFPDSKPRVPAVMNSSYDVNSDDKLQTSFQKNFQDKIPERSVIYSSRGNLSRTIFNPAVLKKTDIASGASSLGRQKDDKKDTLVKRIELHRKKHELLENHIKQQKFLLAKLSVSKSEKDKASMKQMIKVMETKISALQADFKKGAEDLKNDFKMCSSQVSTKSEAEKAWLDAEMDLYNKQHKGDDTAELLSKVNELKQKAKAFGLFHSSPTIDGGLKAKRGSLQFQKPINSSAALLKIDYRPKTLLVSGFKEKETLVKHFLQYGDVEKINETKSGITITFSTRKIAEVAFSNGKKLGDKNLVLSWYQEEQNNAAEGQKDGTSDKSKDESLNLDADEDEEDEEDSEARSWRR